MAVTLDFYERLGRALLAGLSELFTSNFSITRGRGRLADDLTGQVDAWLAVPVPLAASSFNYSN
jgi:hypothetical protein